MSSIDTRVDTTFTHTITLDESEQFEMFRRYSAQQFRVREIVVTVTVHDNRDAPTDVNIRVSGPRVLKNRLSEQTLTDGWYSYGRGMASGVPEPVLAAVRPYINFTSLGIEVAQ